LLPDGNSFVRDLRVSAAGGEKLCEAGCGADMKKNQGNVEQPASTVAGHAEDTQKGEARQNTQPLDGIGEDAQAVSGPQGFLGALTVFSLSNDATLLGAADPTGFFAIEGANFEPSTVEASQSAGVDRDIAQAATAGLQDSAPQQSQERTEQDTVDQSQGFDFGRADETGADDSNDLDQQLQIDGFGTAPPEIQVSVGEVAASPAVASVESSPGLTSPDVAVDATGTSLTVGSIDFSKALTIFYTEDGAGFISDGLVTSSFENISSWTLSDLNDTVYGSLDGAGISVDAGGGDDTLIGGTGDDAVQGGSGDDAIDGGAGSDTVIYDGDLQDFTIVFDSAADRFTITDGRIADGDEGTDTVTGVETFVFDGTTYSRAQIEAYADGSAPTAIGFATGGALYETVADGGTIDADFDPSGTLLGTLQATDASGPGDTHRFELISDPSGKFEVVGNELRIGSGQTIDFEADTSFDIVLRTTDINGNTHDELMTINVNNYQGSYTVSGSAENVTGTSEEDVLTGNSGNDTLSGGQGDDVVSGGDGGDVLSGGDGDDTLTGGSGGDVLDGGSGDDDLQGGDDADSFTLQDGFGADTLLGGEGGNDSDLIDASGLTSAVTVTYSGNEAGTIDDGTDTANFSQVERLLLSDGADSVAGGNDSVGLDIDAGAGNDTLIGGIGDDVLFGGEGNDIIAGYSGDDTIYGGDGDDVIALNNGTSDESAFGGAGNDEIYGSFTATSTIVGGSGDDSLIGFANDNIIRGGDGDDVIFGGGSGETLEGGADSDQFFLVGNFDNDRIVGGEATTTGEDSDNITANVGFSAVSVTFTGDEAGTITNGSSTASFSEIEEISLLRPYDNSVDATFDSSGITVFTSGGDDTVIGGSGDDSIVTGDDDDLISAGAGNDTLSGGTGDDTLIGGDGDDLFLVASSISDTDEIDGGAGGGWTDEIALVGMGAGAVAQVAADTYDGDGWTLVMDAGHTVTSINGGVLELSSDASGVINFDDGGSVTFADTDRVTW